MANWPVLAFPSRSGITLTLPACLATLTLWTEEHTPTEHMTMTYYTATPTPMDAAAFMHAMMDAGAGATIACTQFAAATTCASAKFVADKAQASAPCLANDVASAADATTKLALISASAASATCATATGFAHRLLDAAASRAQTAYAAAEAAVPICPHHQPATLDPDTPNSPDMQPPQSPAGEEMSYRRLY